MQMYIATFARAYISASERAAKRPKKLKATKDTPVIFGRPSKLALDVTDLVHLELYKQNKEVWARFYVTWFRQLVLLEGSRLQPISSLNFISRAGFNELSSKYNGLRYGNTDVNMHGLYIIVEHKKGETPSYTYWKNSWRDVFHYG